MIKQAVYLGVNFSIVQNSSKIRKFYFYFDYYS